MTAKSDSRINRPRYFSTTSMLATLATFKAERKFVPQLFLMISISRATRRDSLGRTNDRIVAPEPTAALPDCLQLPGLKMEVARRTTRENGRELGSLEI